MAKIMPFKGYRYSTDKIENPAEVMAPPYDSLSDEEDVSYYDMSPYNAVRLVSKRNHESHNDCYERSKDFLNSWIDDRILVKEDKPAIYVYEETVTINGENYYSRGIVSLLELTEYEKGVVVPCEEPSTHSINDRLSMISATESNNSLVSCMYTDISKGISSLFAEVQEIKPQMEFVTSNDQRHKLWVITDENKIKLVQKELEDKKIFIVDGHNRYEACLEYKKNAMKKGDYTGKESYNYIMTLISYAGDDGRVHMPVHRLVKCGVNFSDVYLVAGIQDNFKVEKIIVDKSDDDMGETMRRQIATQRQETKFALYMGTDFFYKLTFKGEKYLNSIMPDVSDSYRNLDLNILNKLMFEEQFGINESNEAERVTYTRSINEGIAAVDNKEYTCLFVVNPVRPPQFEAMTKTGEKLPKRSVSIFPKPATGIVIHKFCKDLLND